MYFLCVKKTDTNLSATCYPDFSVIRSIQDIHLDIFKVYVTMCLSLCRINNSTLLYLHCVLN